MYAYLVHLSYLLAFSLSTLYFRSHALTVKSRFPERTLVAELIVSALQRTETAPVATVNYHSATVSIYFRFSSPFPQTHHICVYTIFAYHYLTEYD